MTDNKVTKNDNDVSQKDLEQSLEDAEFELAEKQAAAALGTDGDEAFSKK